MKIGLTEARIQVITLLFSMVPLVLYKLNLRSRKHGKNSPRNEWKNPPIYILWLSDCWTVSDQT